MQVCRPGALHRARGQASASRTASAWPPGPGAAFCFGAEVPCCLLEAATQEFASDASLSLMAALRPDWKGAALVGNRPGRLLLNSLQSRWEGKGLCLHQGIHSPWHSVRLQPALRSPCELTGNESAAGQAAKARPLTGVREEARPQPLGELVGLLSGFDEDRNAEE